MRIFVGGRKRRRNVGSKWYLASTFLRPLQSPPSRKPLQPLKSLTDSFLMPPQRGSSMKHLLTGVAVVAALAFSAPVGAQQASPSAGNAMGMPGPNPGGPGLTPYSAGAPPATAPTGRMPTGGKKLSGSNYVPSTASPSDTTSATPPAHRHARTYHAMHGHMAHGHMAHGPKSLKDTTAQLNQAELARLQQGAPPMPPPMAAPYSPPLGGGNAVGTPGPNPGGPGLTPYSTGTPHESEHGTVQR
jgi:hypothetical protein